MTDVSGHLQRAVEDLRLLDAAVRSAWGMNLELDRYPRGPTTVDELEERSGPYYPTAAHPSLRRATGNPSPALWRPLAHTTHGKYTAAMRMLAKAHYTIGEIPAVKAHWVTDIVRVDDGEARLKRSDRCPLIPLRVATLVVGMLEAILTDLPADLDGDAARAVTRCRWEIAAALKHLNDLSPRPRRFCHVERCVRTAERRRKTCRRHRADRREGAEIDETTAA